MSSLVSRLALCDKFYVHRIECLFHLESIPILDKTILQERHNLSTLELDHDHIVLQKDHVLNLMRVLGSNQTEFPGTVVWPDDKTELSMLLLAHSYHVECLLCALYLLNLPRTLNDLFLLVLFF